MPNALIEAMCVGLPCISTKVSGATELIRSGENGILVNDDAQQLANALSTVIDDASFAESLAGNAMRLYERVNLSTICKQWIDYIDSIENGL
jgi:glycosyltransferase involved in cell wall biosynthesis